MESRLGRVAIIIVVVVAATKGREEGAGVTLVTSPVEVKIVVVVTAALKGGTGQRGGATLARHTVVGIIHHLCQLSWNKVSREHSVSRLSW